MALLKAEHITKTYGQRTIIKDINIELHQANWSVSWASAVPERQRYSTFSPD